MFQPFWAPIQEKDLSSAWLFAFIGDGCEGGSELASDVILKLKELDYLDAVHPEQTALLFSLVKKQFRMAELLILSNADVNAVTKTDIKESCLQIAAQFEDKIMLSLLEHNANINYCGVEQQTAIAAAANSNQYKNVEILLQRGADPNLGKNNALYWATKRQQNPKLNHLLLQNECKGNGVISLSLSGLPITSLPSIALWDTFTSLKTLDLTHCQLDFLPPVLITLPYLTDLQLEGNPLSAIPQHCRDTHLSPTLAEYLHSVVKESKIFPERKLLIVGEEATGKSTLLKCIRKSSGRADCEKNISTNGMSVKENFSIPMGSSLLSRLNPLSYLTSAFEHRFTAWDLGGQEVYYPSHQFFLTTQAIYLLVFNLVHPNFERVDYWMKQLKNCTPRDRKCPIIIVGTHRDEIPGQNSAEVSRILDSVRQRYSIQSYPWLCDVIAVSCSTGEEIFSLKQKLLDLATKGNVHVSPTWISLRNIIREKKDHHDYITWQNFQELSLRCHILPTELDLVTTFLQDIGAIIHFNDKRSKVKELVILNPKWLGDAMANFVTVNNHWQENGILPKERVVHILHNCDTKLRESFLELLEKFGIVIRLSDPTSVNYGSLVIPSLLPMCYKEGFYCPKALDCVQTIAAKTWSRPFPESVIEHGRVYEFFFLPLGFFDRIISSAFFFPPHIKLVEYWRHGILLAFEKENQASQCCLITYRHEAHKETNYPVYKLSIQARMETAAFQDRKEVNVLLLECVKLIEHIISCYFTKLIDSVRRYIPCLHCLRDLPTFSSPYMFLYEECVHTVSSPGQMMYCSGYKLPERAIPLSTLAPDISFLNFTILKDLVPKEKWTFLAKGGFGIVYKAKYNSKEIAIKELIENDNTIEVYNDFRKEVQIMSVLHHPNIVNLLGITVQPLRIISEFISGGDLHKLLCDVDKKLSVALQYRIAYDIAVGMNYLQGFSPPVVHRDLRSPNIFISSTDHNAPICAKVADFGLSAFVAPFVGGALQTWKWLAPEIIDPKSDSYDERSDNYSYAIVLWEMVSMDSPFAEFCDDPDFSKSVVDNEEVTHYYADDLKIKRAIVDLALRPSIPDSCPPVLKEIIELCWVPIPEERLSFLGVMERLEAHITPAARNAMDLALLHSHGNLEEKIAIETENLREIIEPKITAPLNAARLPPVAQLELDHEICGLYVDTDQIWVGLSTGEISLYSMKEMAKFVPIATWKAHDSRITSMIVVGETVWTSGRSGKLAVWDKENGNLIWDTHLHRVITQLVFIPPRTGNGFGRVWAAAGFSAFLFNTCFQPGKSLLFREVTMGKDVACFCITPHSNRVLVGSEKFILIFDDTGRSIGSWPAMDGPIHHIVSLEPEINQFWASSNNEITIWEHPTKQGSSMRIRKMQGGNSKITMLKCVEVMGMEDGIATTRKEIWTSSYDYSVLLWNSFTFTPVKEIKANHNKELLYCLGQCQSFVFLGSSFRDGDTMKGILYLYEIQKEQ